MFLSRIFTKKLFVNASVAGISTLVTLLLLEGAFRLAGLGERPQVASIAVEEFDSTLGWSKRPSVSVTHQSAEYETVETLNSRGLRGPEREIPRPLGARRVLLLGDSFLEGRAVDDDEVVSAALERALHHAAGPDERIEVINGGTVGYGTDHELLFFRKHGIEYEPEVVVLFFYVNDVWWNGAARLGGDPKPQFALSDQGQLEHLTPELSPLDSDDHNVSATGGSWLNRAARSGGAWLADHSRLYFWVRSKTFGRSGSWSLLTEVPVDWRGWKTTSDPETERRWRLTEALIAQLAEEVTASGAAFVIFRVPSIWQVYDEIWERARERWDMDPAEWDPGHDGRRLASICERHALDCIFPVDRFRAVGDEPGAEGLYYEDDVHWAPGGHELAARIVAEHLTGSGVLRRP